METKQVPWSGADDALADGMTQDGKSYREVAEALGRSLNSVKNRFRRKGKLHPGVTNKSRLPITARAPDEELRQEEDKNNCVITSKSSTVRTLEQALEAAKVDLAVWEVERYIANKWDMGSKLRRNDQLQVVELWQVKVWLRRRVPKELSDAADAIIKKM